MIYHIYFEFEVLQLLQMLSHIKKINRERQGYVVCYSTEDMADRVNQGKLFFLANCHLIQKQFLN